VGDAAERRAAVGDATEAPAPEGLTA
jgi:hypothetical protein